MNRCHRLWPAVAALILSAISSPLRAQTVLGPPQLTPSSASFAQDRETQKKNPKDKSDKNDKEDTKEEEKNGDKDEKKDEEPKNLSVHAQATVVSQGNWKFHSPYVGPNSLLPNLNYRTTATVPLDLDWI